MSIILMVGLGILNVGLVGLLIDHNSDAPDKYVGYIISLVGAIISLLVIII